MLNQRTLENILQKALQNEKIQLNPEQFEILFDKFLESEPYIDQTIQPITSQIEDFARDFLTSSTAQEIINDRSKIELYLSKESLEYLSSDPHVGDPGKFIDLLIRRWKRDLEKSQQDFADAKKDPNVIWD